MNGPRIMKTTNLFYCPKCGSRNVSAIYSIPANLKFWIPRNPPKDRCNSCLFEDDMGNFEIFNFQKDREEKINSILK